MIGGSGGLGMKFPWSGPEDPVGDRQTLILALDAEVDRQRTSVGHRSRAISNRASTLVASAGIITSLQSSSSFSIWFMLSICCGLIAAVVGVLVLIPRLGGELDIGQAENDFWNDRDTEAIRNLAQAKLAVLRTDEQALKSRRKLLLWGFILLALSICSSAVHIMGTTIFS